MRVGVFDSGVGGLSVAVELKRKMPTCFIDYCLDQANFPYGTKTEEHVSSLAVSLTKRFVSASSCDALVIACNTVSTIALDQIRAGVDCPVIGVVPAIKPAASLSKSKSIAVLATPRAVQQDYLKKLITQFASDCSVELVGSSELVHAAEAKIRGKEINPSVIRQELTSITKSPSIDTVVLGCTHFPLLRDEITEILGPNVTLVDSGAAIAERTKAVLSSLESTKSNSNSIFGYTSGDPALLWGPEGVPSFVSNLGLSTWKHI